MNELATAQTFVLGSALIVAALLTLEWVETRRTRVKATHRRDRDRPGEKPGGPVNGRRMLAIPI